MGVSRRRRRRCRCPSTMVALPVAGFGYYRGRSGVPPYTMVVYLLMIIIIIIVIFFKLPCAAHDRRGYLYAVSRPPASLPPRGGAGNGRSEEKIRARGRERSENVPRRRCARHEGGGGGNSVYCRCRVYTLLLLLNMTYNYYYYGLFCVCLKWCDTASAHFLSSQTGSRPLREGCRLDTALTQEKDSAVCACVNYVSCLIIVRAKKL